MAAASEAASAIASANACAACGAADPRKQCQRCALACYCSAKCQRNHWRAGHREACKAWLPPFAELLGGHICALGFPEQAEALAAAGEEKEEVTPARLARVLTRALKVAETLSAGGDAELSEQLHKARAAVRAAERLGFAETAANGEAVKQLAIATRGGSLPSLLGMFPYPSRNLWVLTRPRPGGVCAALGVHDICGYDSNVNRDMLGLVLNFSHDENAPDVAKLGGSEGIWGGASYTVPVSEKQQVADHRAIIAQFVVPVPGGLKVPHEQLAFLGHRCCTFMGYFYIICGRLLRCSDPAREADVMASVGFVRNPAVAAEDLAHDLRWCRLVTPKPREGTAEVTTLEAARQPLTPEAEQAQLIKAFKALFGQSPTF